MAIGRFVLRSREQLVAVRPRGRALILDTMRFADELIDRSDLKVPAMRRAPSEKEVQMARRLIDSLAEQWRPARHRDRYREAVLEVIERKAQGEEIEIEDPPPDTEPADLMGALRESIESSSRKAKGRRTGRRGKSKAKTKSASRPKATKGGG